jgi:hypothetical protein
VLEIDPKPKADADNAAEQQLGDKPSEQVVGGLAQVKLLGAVERLRLSFHLGGFGLQLLRLLAHLHPVLYEREAGAHSAR